MPQNWLKYIAHTEYCWPQTPSLPLTVGYVTPISPYLLRVGIYTSHSQLNQTANAPRWLLSHPAKNNVTADCVETLTTKTTIDSPTGTFFVYGDGPYHSFSLTYQGMCA